MSRWTRNKVAHAVQNSVNYSECLRVLDLPVSGGNYKSLKKYIQKYDLSIDHFTFQPRNENRPMIQKGKKPLTDILVKKSTYTHSSRLKKRLIRAEMLIEKCSKCGLTDWLGEEIVLHLDHINGNRRDNRLENLQLLCPNCHSQTPTYAGRNARKNPINKCSDCGTEDLRPESKRCYSCHRLYLSEVQKGLRDRDPTRKHTPASSECPDCGKAIHRQSNRCGPCHKKQIRRFDPTPEELEKLVWEMPMTKLGEKFGVSGNAIKKRCKKYGIKTPGRGYWAKKRADKV